MTIKQALDDAITQLRPLTNEASLEAAILLAEVVGKDRTWLVAHDKDSLTPSQQRRFDTYLQERLTDKPLAYIINKREFYKHQFYIDEGALIPRPETEFLVESVIDCVSQSDKDDWTIADIGTGSGNTAISIALALPHSTVLATEISQDAIKVAQKNLKLLNAKNVMLFTGSLTDPIKDRPVDIFVANLPYILKDRIPHLDNQVKNWEPRVALDGGDDGFDLYREFFDQVSTLSHQPQLIIGEIDYSHDEMALKSASTFFPTYSAQIAQDHQGLSRFIVITQGE